MGHLIATLCTHGWSECIYLSTILSQFSRVGSGTYGLWNHTHHLQSCPVCHKWDMVFHTYDYFQYINIINRNMDFHTSDYFEMYEYNQSQHRLPQLWLLWNTWIQSIELQDLKPCCQFPISLSAKGLMALRSHDSYTAQQRSLPRWSSIASVLQGITFVFVFKGLVPIRPDGVEKEEWLVTYFN